MSVTDALTVYGPLGVWVVYSIIREKWLMQKMEELSLRFDGERTRWNRERMAWIRLVGKRLKVSDETIMEITDND
tara:strand:+ start:5948 stop:6172 length:225 start_codon:yes stop_codon:yes gene_type:complete